MLAGVWQKLKMERVAGNGLATLAADWQALSARAQEPAGFLTAEFMLPILAQAKGAEVDGLRHDNKLLMAVPTVAGRGFDSVIASDLTASSLPLVDEEQGQEAVRAFINARKRPFLFKSIPLDSKIYAQLQALAPRLQVMKSWQRAALKIDGAFESWLNGNFDHKRRKEFKRLRNRLGEQGELKLETLSQSSNVQNFVENLLALEAKGWKGRRGTALQARTATASAFKQICINLQTAGKLRFWQLRHEGKAIASLFGMVEGDRAWIVKIAHDEAFAKFSPGVLLVLDATQSLFAEGGVKLVDSCAIPGHPMIDRIWRDRIAMADVLIAPAHVSRAQFTAVSLALLVHGKLREAAKHILYKLMKRNMS
jgi:CelD/BcsL family acetyltransferase involved in cellulose biosynthesis